MNFKPDDEMTCLSWLLELIKTGDYEVIVPVERKATAILRAILDLSDLKCNWNWSHVISTEALPYLPRDFLKGKHILVFNEMIHRGRSTREAMELIEANTQGAVQEVETAAFFVHEDFETEGVWETADFRASDLAKAPDHAIERGVPDSEYAEYRESLIRILRARGALLLDTEHLETTFTYRIPNRTFLNALRRFGIPIEYQNDEGGGYPGITVCRPVPLDREHLQRILPSGADIVAEEPRKVRIIRRGPAEFAAIPIWYPPVPLDAVREPSDWANAPEYVQPALHACPKESLPELAFHLAGLVAGLELVRSVWAGLSPWVNRGIEPDIPEGSDTPGSALGHLRALYPLLDFETLEQELRTAISVHREQAAATHVSKLAAQLVAIGPQVISEGMLWNECLSFLITLVRQQKRKKAFAGESWFTDLYPDSFNRRRFPPSSWRELWAIAQQLQIKESLFSVIMDTAIDRAILKTSHAKVLRGEITYIVRSFEADSEFALEAIERLVHGAEKVTLNV